MKFNADILRRYISQAPVALAFERTLECEIYRSRPFASPVLDVGCGDGLFAEILFADRLDTGIDLDRDELERARRYGKYHELLQCEGARIPKPDASYATIFSNSVLEHIPEIEPVLREIFRLLRPGGNFYFTVPSDCFERYTVINQLIDVFGLAGISIWYRGFFNRFWKHYHCYTPEQWQTLARKSGFEIVEAFAYNPKRICLLDDFLAPWALPSMLLKRFAGRWVLSPALRWIVFYPFYLIGRRVLRNGERAEGGGLVFVHASKAR